MTVQTTGHYSPHEYDQSIQFIASSPAPNNIGGVLYVSIVQPWTGSRSAGTDFSAAPYVSGKYTFQIKDQFGHPLEGASGQTATEIHTNGDNSGSVSDVHFPSDGTVSSSGTVDDTWSFYTITSAPTWISSDQQICIGDLTSQVCNVKLNSTESFDYTVNPVHFNWNS